MKQQSSEWKSSNSSRPKKVRLVKSSIKTMRTALFTQNLYLMAKLLTRRFTYKFWKKPRQHASAQSRECETIFNQKQHDPAYPPDIFTLSRSVILLFIPLNEKSPQRKIFCGHGRGEEKVTEALKGITLQEFEDSFEKWKTCLDQCIASNGE
jgi:hypothetical protein